VSASHLALGILALLAIGGVAVYSALRLHPAGVKYTQLTDFTDSALAPALSPDGRMVAFIRGSSSFLTADQIFVKVLPNGEARRLTDDSRLKYNLAFTPDGAQIAYTVRKGQRSLSPSPSSQTRFVCTESVPWTSVCQGEAIQRGDPVF
jgi:dipeptidyl aminopeptidase/acylaminoacyl peptidase